MSLLLILALAVADPPEPAAGPVADLRQKVIEAIRNCPKQSGDEIVVCSRDRGVAESYRLPKLDPRFAAVEPPPSVVEILDGVGDAGIGSCSRVGAGGSIGCARRDYDDWAARRRRLRAEQKARDAAK